MGTVHVVHQALELCHELKLVHVDSLILMTTSSQQGKYDFVGIWFNQSDVFICWYVTGDGSSSEEEVICRVIDKACSIACF